MSDKEKSELLASGSCVRCKKPGHMSRNCPQGNIVKSSGNSNKPPGLTSYNTELEPELIESDEAEPIDSLELGTINWQASGNIDWIEDEPSWLVYDPSLPRRTLLGDALALMSEYVLDIMQPYLGDSNAIGDNGIRQCFSVYRTTNPDWYRIMDHLPANSCVIPTSKLENPYFRLGEWYSHRLSHWLKKLRKLDRKWTMGDAYCINAMCVLCSGIPTLYPSSDPDLDPQACFHVTRGEPNEFIIYDEEFVQPIRIDKSIITNTHFDLAKWYQVQHYPRLPFDGENVDLDLSSLEFLDGGYEPTSDQVGDTGSDNNDDDAPDLQSMSDSDWNEHRGSTSNLSGASTDSDWDERTYNPMGDILGEAVAQILESSEPYPGDTNFSQHLHDRFEVVRVGDEQYQVHDRHQQMFCYLPVHMVRQPDFAPG